MRLQFLCLLSNYPLTVRNLRTHEVGGTLRAVGWIVATLLDAEK